MTSGGARNRSGPRFDPLSARSDRRGVSLAALPSEGYRGVVPAFPLMPRVVADDEAMTVLVAEREAELWAWAWRTPQACAWALPSEAWRINAIAMWVRVMVKCEADDATAADRSSVHRFADQIGLTPAGLKENGWAVASDEVPVQDAPGRKPSQSVRDRAVASGQFKVIPGGQKAT